MSVKANNTLAPEILWIPTGWKWSELDRRATRFKPIRSIRINQRSYLAKDPGVVLIEIVALRVCEQVGQYQSSVYGRERDRP